MQRSIQWVASIAHTGQKGYLKQLKPFIKKIDLLFERIFAGNKFEITSTEVLLMSIVIMLIVVAMEIAYAAQNPKPIVVKSTTSKAKEN